MLSGKIISLIEEMYYDAHDRRDCYAYLEDDEVIEEMNHDHDSFAELQKALMLKKQGNDRLKVYGYESRQHLLDEIHKKQEKLRAELN
ncbi:hypothetical protein [Pseudobutyrivibrio sp.]